MNSANMTITLPCSLNNRNTLSLIRGITPLKSNVVFIKDGRSAQAKSLLGLLSLCCHQGDTVEIVCMSRDSDVERDLQEIVEVLNKL